MDMELAELEAFITIAELGTFTGAARVLHVSQPAISRRIDLLEHELGSSLFQRDRSGARLTDAGEALLPFAAAVLASVRDGKAAVEGLRQDGAGTTTLALVGTLASTSLVERLAVFRDTHPAVRLMLRTQTSDGVSHLVQRGDASIGLRYFAAPAMSLESMYVWSERMVVVSSSLSRLVTADRVCVDDLDGVPWVTYPVGTGSSGEPFARAMERHLVRIGLPDAERIEIDSLTTQKRMIEVDFGIGLLPESAVAEETRVGSLRVVDLPELAASAPVFLVRRRGGYESAATRALVDVLTGGNAHIPEATDEPRVRP